MTAPRAAHHASSRMHCDVSTSAQKPRRAQRAAEAAQSRLSGKGATAPWRSWLPVRPPLRQAPVPHVRAKNKSAAARTLNSRQVAVWHRGRKKNRGITTKRMLFLFPGPPFLCSHMVTCQSSNEKATTFHHQRELNFRQSKLLKYS